MTLTQLVICRGDPDKTIILSDYYTSPSSAVTNVTVDTSNISTSVVTVSPTSSIASPNFPFTITNNGIGGGSITFTVHAKTKPTPSIKQFTIYIMIYNCMTIPVCSGTETFVKYLDIIGYDFTQTAGISYLVTAPSNSNIGIINPSLGDTTLQIHGNSIGTATFTLGVLNTLLISQKIDSFDLLIKVQVVECKESFFLDPIIVCKDTKLDEISVQYYCPYFGSGRSVSVSSLTTGTTTSPATVVATVNNTAYNYPITIIAGPNPGLTFVIIIIKNSDGTTYGEPIYLPVIIYDCTPIKICKNASQPYCKLITDIIGSASTSPSIDKEDFSVSHLTTGLTVSIDSNNECINISSGVTGLGNFVFTVSGLLLGSSVIDVNGPPNLVFATDIKLAVDVEDCPQLTLFRPILMCVGDVETLNSSDYFNRPGYTITGVSISDNTVPSSVATISGPGASPNYTITITANGLGYGFFRINVDLIDDAGIPQPPNFTQVFVFVYECTPISVCIGKTVCVPFSQLWEWDAIISSLFDITINNHSTNISADIDTLNQCLSITGNTYGSGSVTIEFVGKDPVSHVSFFINLVVQVIDCDRDKKIAAYFTDFLLSLNGPRSLRC